MLFKKDIKSDIGNLQIEYRDLSELVYRLTCKVNSLFERDKHGTERPKTGLLSDEFDKFEKEVWNHFRMLQERIEKLEKDSCKVDLSKKTER